MWKWSQPINENVFPVTSLPMGILPDTLNCGLRLCWECRERLPRHRLKRKPLVSNLDIHHGTCVPHAPSWMSGSLTRDGGDNVPGILGACTTRNFTYLARDPFSKDHRQKKPRITVCLFKQTYLIVDRLGQWNLFYGARISSVPHIFHNELYTVPT